VIIFLCIGLIGFVTFNTELKIKEIGVRKVCGSKNTGIIVLLTKGIIIWFFVGFCISCILSWFLMTRWLENFAFRIAMNWWIFIEGMVIVLIITALTVSWQTWKAARTNPVDALKYE
jgi:putative ABC transport system permease protein